MVRAIKSRLFASGLKHAEIYGLSTDSKPTGGLVTGSKFTEVDTGAVYLYDETNDGTWYLFQNGPTDDKQPDR